MTVHNRSFVQHADEGWGHLTKRKIVRQEPSGWPLVAHNGPYSLRIILLLSS